MTPSWSFGASASTGDSGGECSGGLCGAPNQTGGGGCGCGCGGGSILIAMTDRGDTYQFADDYDGDGLEDDFDNCAFVANGDQVDDDGDGVGSACDVCVNAGNEDQLDTDSDGVGNACDADDDGDGINDVSDLCALVADPSQLDADGDQAGNACDTDDDNDGALDGADNCPLVPNADQGDVTGISGCDSDSDADGRPDSVDNCVGALNFEQDDLNENGVGDACDGDIDGDGIANIRDNCPRNNDQTQVDSDRDGSGDLCDNRFCIVFDRSNADACLDPATTFKAMSFDNQTVNVGEDVLMRLFANRDNAAIRYTWTILNRPEGSSATIENPVGSVTYSSANEYRYLADQLPVLTPDAAGVYEIQLSTELVFADAQFPNNNTSRTTIKLTAEGEGGSSGCAAAPGKGNSLGLAMLFLTGALFLGRRRRS
jgi:uncharacterized protein (TIGR03382 family)